MTPAFLAALDPSLLPDPPAEPAPPSQHQSYTCLARLSAPVWVQLLGSNNSVDATKTEYGKLTLKTCLSAICISRFVPVLPSPLSSQLTPCPRRPELVTDPTKDYAVSAVDPYESSLQPSPASSAGQGLMEGKGMLSWNLAEKREGTTWVCGRVVVDENAGSKRRKVEEEDDGDGEGSEDEEEGSDTLEVWLQLVEVSLSLLRTNQRTQKLTTTSSVPRSPKLNSSPPSARSPTQTPWTPPTAPPPLPAVANLSPPRSATPLKRSDHATRTRVDTLSPVLPPHDLFLLSPMDSQDSKILKSSPC